MIEEDNNAHKIVSWYANVLEDDSEPNWETYNYTYWVDKSTKRIHYEVYFDYFNEVEKDWWTGNLFVKYLDPNNLI